MKARKILVPVCGLEEPANCIHSKQLDDADYENFCYSTFVLKIKDGEVVGKECPYCIVGEMFLKEAD
jgi:hypothetical protein